MFESSPQSQFAIAYNLAKVDGTVVHMVAIFAVSSKEPRTLLLCNDEVIQMCTPGTTDGLIVGTQQGSFYLYDLTEVEEAQSQPSAVGVLSDDTRGADYEFFTERLVPDYASLPPYKKTAFLEKARMKYPVKTPAFSSDGLAEHPHLSPIQKLVFISRAPGRSVAKIGALDQDGIISVWSVVEGENLTGEYDLNMSIGCKFKLSLNFTENLLDHPAVLAEDDPLGLNFASETVEIEFDPVDPQLFFFSTSRGLFKIDKNETVATPQLLDTVGLNCPTALSICDRGFLLAAYSCGSIW